MSQSLAHGSDQLEVPDIRVTVLPSASDSDSDSVRQPE
jgi:hypothetical protein